MSRLQLQALTTDGSNSSALHAAASLGHHTVVSALLAASKRAGLDERLEQPLRGWAMWTDAEGVTALHTAAAEGFTEVVAALRRAGVPILILHGENDLIIPAYNSRRLLKQLGGGDVGASGVPVPGDAPVRLLELPACGHCPQEEMAEVVR